MSKQLRLQEIPDEEKIIERRGIWGQLKVLGSWLLIWNTIHQIAWDFAFAVVICGVFTCSAEDALVLRVTRTMVAAGTSILHIILRMDRNARRRWLIKYG